ERQQQIQQAQGADDNDRGDEDGHGGSRVAWTGRAGGRSPRLARNEGWPLQPAGWASAADVRLVAGAAFVLATAGVVAVLQVGVAAAAVADDVLPVWRTARARAGARHHRAEHAIGDRDDNTHKLPLSPRWACWRWLPAWPGEACRAGRVVPGSAAHVAAG